LARAWVRKGKRGELAGLRWVAGGASWADLVVEARVGCCCCWAARLVLLLFFFLFLKQKMKKKSTGGMERSLRIMKICSISWNCPLFDKIELGIFRGRKIKQV
jgi:hypothetical protein